MNRMIKVLVVLVILSGCAVLVAASYYFAPVIDANQRGVVMTGNAAAGENLKVLAPGKHYWFVSGYNPITTTLARVEISDKELDLSSADSSGTELVTQDGDTIIADFSVWYHIIPEQAGLYLVVAGDSDIHKMVKDITIAAAQEEAAHYNAEKFYKAETHSEYLAAVKANVNQQLADRGVELTVFKCSKFNYSKELLQKEDEIKRAQFKIEVNKVKVRAAAVAALETEERAKGRKLAAIQEAEARKESVIMASEAQIVAAKNWVTAEKIKAEILVVRSKAKVEAMQIEAAANVFSGTEGERFLRYRIADSLADAWTQSNNLNAGKNTSSLDDVVAGIKNLSTPVRGEAAK